MFILSFRWIICRWLLGHRCWNWRLYSDSLQLWQQERRYDFRIPTTRVRFSQVRKLPTAVPPQGRAVCAYAPSHEQVSSTSILHTVYLHRFKQQCSFQNRYSTWARAL